jgi:hypothetical protein
MSVCPLGRTALQRAINAAKIARGEPVGEVKDQGEFSNYLEADAPDYAQQMSAGQQRVNEYFAKRTDLDVDVVQEYKKRITQVVMQHDRRGELAGYYIQSEIPGQLIEWLSYHPETIKRLVNSPPEQRALDMARLEGHAFTLGLQSSSLRPSRKASGGGSSRDLNRARHRQ